MHWRTLKNKTKLPPFATVIILLIISSVLLAGLVFWLTQTPINADLLSTDNAKMELQANQEFLIFWAILFFTFITGIIALVAPIKKAAKDNQAEVIILSLIYVGLLIGMMYSIERAWAILRENTAIFNTGKLGQDFINYLKGKSIFEQLGLQTVGAEIAILIGVWIVFVLLLVIETGYLYPVKTTSEQTSVAYKRSNYWKIPKTATLFLIIVVGIIGGILAYAFINTNVDIAVFLATAISALAYVLFTYWDEKIESPNLKILFDPLKTDLYTPQLGVHDANGNVINARFVRVVIQNDGTKAAHGCVGKIQLLTRPTGCTMFSEEPKTLKWTDIPAGDYIPPKGGTAVLGIAVAFDLSITIAGTRCALQNNPNTLVKAFAHTPEALANPANRAQDAFCTGEFKLRLTLYCEEGNTVSADCTLTVDNNWNMLNMHL